MRHIHLAVGRSREVRSSVMSNRTRRQLVAVIIAIVVAIIAYFRSDDRAVTPTREESKSTPRAESRKSESGPAASPITPDAPATLVEGESGKVVRVSDGDTLSFRSSSGEGLVRLIGVDAPEIDGPYRKAEKGGIEAREFVRSITSGRNARLVRDPENSNDPHGRTLAYVYLEDGRFLNLEIVRAGHARVYRKFRFRERDRMIEAEREARDARRGMWGTRSD